VLVSAKIVWLGFGLSALAHLSAWSSLGLWFVIFIFVTTASVNSSKFTFVLCLLLASFIL
jgi:hypothetical protein